MLREQYQAFFELFTKTVLLRAPSFESIVSWRKKQEHKLRNQLITSGGLAEFSGLMSDTAIDRFVMHYERLTRWMLSEMPYRADACLYLNEEHGIDRLVVKKYD
jgi:D-glycerate 3-kinase